MRPLLLLCSFGLVLTMAACTDDAPDPATAPSSNVEARTGQAQEMDPEPVPDVTMETMDGQSLSVADQEGNVLLINFWATWCAPCLKEIPDLVSLQSELGPQGLTVIGVALDRDGAEVVEPFVEKHEINYPIVIDDDQTVESELGPTYGLPTTLVVNTEGQIVKRVVGIFPTEEMKPELESMLTSADTDA